MYTALHVKREDRLDIKVHASGRQILGLDMTVNTSDRQIIYRSFPLDDLHTLQGRSFV